MRQVQLPSLQDQATGTWFQTRASPGIARVKLWLLLTDTCSGSATHIACPGNLAALNC